MGFIVNFLLVACLSFCAALAVAHEGQHYDVDDRIARVQSHRALQIGPMQGPSTGSAAGTQGGLLVPHGRSDANTGAATSSYSSSTGASTNTATLTGSGVNQNPPPSIPIVHPAVDLSNDSAAAVPSVNANGSTTTTTNTALDAAADSVLGAAACEPGGECTRLGEAIVTAGESPECRALFITGKCSAKCLASLKDVAEHKLWAACAKRCDTDLVTGAASRLVELCQVRQPTLLDASKEALQIVAAAPGAGRLIRAFLVISVMFAALMFCNKRKTTLRLLFQKRLKRRSSERSIV